MDDRGQPGGGGFRGGYSTARTRWSIMIEEDELRLIERIREDKKRRGSTGSKRDQKDRGGLMDHGGCLCKRGTDNVPASRSNERTIELI
jgi:hypothetical protein